MLAINTPVFDAPFKLSVRKWLLFNLCLCLESCLFIISVWFDFDQHTVNRWISAQDTCISNLGEDSLFEMLADTCRTGGALIQRGSLFEGGGVIWGFTVLSIFSLTFLWLLVKSFTFVKPLIKGVVFSKTEEDTNLDN